jgi:lysophospholipase L1-like esterase
VGSSIRCVSVCIAVWVGCGRGTVSEVRVDPVPRSPPASGVQETLPRFASVATPSGALHLAAPNALPTAEGALVFQPGFHQALRWSDQTPGLVTFRFKIPVARGGNRIRVALRAGDGPLNLHRATVARAGLGQTLLSDPIPLTFDGKDGLALGPGERILSDPLPFPVEAQEDLAVSFAADGALASSAINAFPESFLASGNQVFERHLADAMDHHRLIGVQTIEVEGRYDRVFVALGDSITEGYVTGDDDHRLAWPALAGAASGRPVVNAAVSGQGLWEATEHLHEDVEVLHGHTDCLVLLGTNDLAGRSATQIIEVLSAFFDALSRRNCRVWAGTLLPKELTTTGDLTLVKTRRAEVNNWIRHRSPAYGVIDFEAAMAAPGDPNRFAPGLGEDGIHPSYAGQKAMAEFAAQIISAQPRR